MSYDGQLKQSQYIKFLPYIGENYAQADQKILVLGHSHYANHDGSPKEITEWDTDTERTRDVISKEYLEAITASGTHPESYVRCYRYMAAALTGETYQKSDYIWKGLAFYNFYQKHAGTTHNGRQYITSELTNSSQKALFEVIDILKPNLVIAWGSELFDGACLPDEGYTAIMPSANSSTDEDTSLRLGSYDAFPTIYFWFIKHPSKGFSYVNEHVNWRKVQQIIQEQNA